MYYLKIFSEKYFEKFGYKIQKQQIIKFDIYMFKMGCM